MFFARSHIELHNIRRSVERIGTVSDNVVRLGPIKLGLEAVLEFVPFVGEAYSLVAGGLLIIQGARARVPIPTLILITLLIGLRTVIGASNLLGPLGAFGEILAAAFRAHKMSADMIVKAIDDALYIEGTARDPENADVMARIHAGQEQRRIVQLGGFLSARKPR